MSSSDPIGVFDSGVGGLSVLREVRILMPAEDLVYVADSGAAPYGDRTREFIIDRARLMAAFLQSRRAKAIVVACNTATVVAVETLRRELTLPIVAIEPAVKPAVQQTRAGAIGVLATSQTLASESLSRLMREFGGGVRVVLQAAPGLVERVERGEVDGPETHAVVAAYVRPLLEAGVDTIVLGCTHYPFLARVIQAIAGPEVLVVDPATAVARELRRRLGAARLLTERDSAGSEEFWSTGDLATARAVIGQLWGRDVEVLGVPAATAALPAS